MNVLRCALDIDLGCVQGKQYNITNEALIGAFFLPAGLGNISSSFHSLATSAEIAHQANVT